MLTSSATSPSEKNRSGKAAMGVNGMSGFAVEVYMICLYRHTSIQYGESLHIHSGGN